VQNLRASRRCLESLLRRRSVEEPIPAAVDVDAPGAGSRAHKHDLRFGVDRVATAVPVAVVTATAARPRSREVSGSDDFEHSETLFIAQLG